MMATKTCTRCGEDKDLDDFGHHSTGLMKRKSTCRRCCSIRARESTWKSQGIDCTWEDYLGLVELQQNRCAICGEPPTAHYGRLTLDHNHATGGVRGLLCHSCNVAIGHLRDNPTIARSAAEYLER